MEFGYEKLDVTRLAKRLIYSVYCFTKDFPDSEKFALSNQVRRSATSILLNIAEGSARHSKREFNHFVRIAIGSLVELDASLKLAVEFQYLQQKKFSKIEPCIKELYFKLIGLSKYLRSKE